VAQLTLYHEILDDPMEDGAFVTLRNTVLLELARAQLTKVLCRFRAQISVQLEQHPTQGRVAH
jgi:hypothetical protein